MFATFKDAYGELALWRKVEASHPGAMEGWELICHAKDFPQIIEAIQK